MDIRLTAADGHTFDTYLAEPEGDPRGAIVVIQEIFGVNAHIRDVTGRFAAAGYHAVAPAYFHRSGGGAVEDYTEALLLDPESAESILEERAVTSFLAGNYDQSAADFSTLIRLDPRNFTYYARRGLAYSHAGAFAQAAADCTEAIRLGVESHTIYLQRAEAWLGAGDANKAVTDLDEVIRHAPREDLARAYDLRGSAWVRLREYDRAIADHDSAIRIAPNDAGYFASRSRAWREKGDVAKALADHDLTDRKDQAVTTLSGGEFSRAMLARALVARPDIVIVDEPVTGLDPVHAFSAMARLAAWAAGGRAVIASLHDLTLAARYAGRILALKRGRVAGEGALTAGLIREVFGVESEVHGTGANVKVDFLLP